MANITIKPNYRVAQKCYYCAKRLAEEKYSKKETWYGITKVIRFPMGVRFLAVDVEIPRCQQCEKKHSTTVLPMIILFFIGEAYGLYIFFSSLASSWSDQPLGTILVLGVITFLNMCATFIVGMIIKYALWLLLYRNECCEEGDTRDYPPIKKLICCGFQYTKPDPAASRGAKTINFDRFRQLLDDYSSDGKMIVTEK